MFPLPSSDADSRAKSNRKKNKKNLRPVIYVYVLRGQSIKKSCFFETCQDCWLERINFEPGIRLLKKFIGE
jgi:hypothetical protein